MNGGDGHTGVSLHVSYAVVKSKNDQVKAGGHHICREVLFIERVPKRIQGVVTWKTFRHDQRIHDAAVSRSVKHPRVARRGNSLVADGRCELPVFLIGRRYRRCDNHLRRRLQHLSARVHAHADVLGAIVGVGRFKRLVERHLPVALSVAHVHLDFGRRLSGVGKIEALRDHEARLESTMHGLFA